MEIIGHRHHDGKQCVVGNGGLRRSQVRPTPVAIIVRIVVRRAVAASAL
jgi:hypothetical protein